MSPYGGDGGLLKSDTLATAVHSRKTADAYQVRDEYGCRSLSPVPARHIASLLDSRHHTHASDMSTHTLLRDCANVD